MVFQNMAQHSTHLQNLTHADIIRIGAAFEDDLRAELKRQAQLDLADKLAEQDAKHQARLDEAAAERGQLVVEHEAALIAKESEFAARLDLARVEWRQALQGEIDEEKEKARLDEQKRALEAASEEKKQEEKRLSSLRNDFEKEKEMVLESQRRQTQAEFGQAKATLVNDLTLAKREISKLKYTESERAEYVDELIKDIKVFLIILKIN